MQYLDLIKQPSAQFKVLNFVDLTLNFDIFTWSSYNIVPSLEYDVTWDECSSDFILPHSRQQVICTPRKEDNLLSYSDTTSLVKSKINIHNISNPPQLDFHYFTLIEENEQEYETLDTWCLLVVKQLELPSFLILSRLACNYTPCSGLKDQKPYPIQYQTPI